MTHYVLWLNCNIAGYCSTWLHTFSPKATLTRRPKERLMHHSTYRRSLRLVATLAAMTLPLGFALPAIADDDVNSRAIILPTDETSTPAEKTPADDSSSVPEPSGTPDHQVRPFLPPVWSRQSQFPPKHYRHHPTSQLPYRLQNQLIRRRRTTISLETTRMLSGEMG